MRLMHTCTLTPNTYATYAHMHSDTNTYATYAHMHSDHEPSSTGNSNSRNLCYYIQSYANTAITHMSDTIVPQARQEGKATQQAAPCVLLLRSLHSYANDHIRPYTIPESISLALSWAPPFETRLISPPSCGFKNR